MASGHRYCEEQSDEAIQSASAAPLDCFASLAMTMRGPVTALKSKPDRSHPLAPAEVEAPAIIRKPIFAPDERPLPQRDLRAPAQPQPARLARVGADRPEQVVRVEQVEIAEPRSAVSRRGEDVQPVGDGRDSEGGAGADIDLRPVMDRQRAAEEFLLGGDVV